MDFDNLASQSQEALDIIKKARSKALSEGVKKYFYDRGGLPRNEHFFEMTTKDFGVLKSRANVEKTVIAQKDLSREEN